MKNLKKMIINLYYRLMKGIDMNVFENGKGIWLQLYPQRKGVEFLQYELVSGFDKKKIIAFADLLSDYFPEAKIIGETKKGIKTITIEAQEFSEYQQQKFEQAIAKKKFFVIMSSI